MILLWQRPGTGGMKLLVLLIMMGMVAGCESGIKTSDRNLNILDYDQLTSLLETSRTPPLVIDVRQPQEFASGHIPGAVNIPVLELQPNDPRLGEATHIVVYSQGWTPLRNDRLSWAAAKKLLAMGYVGVHDYRGGIDSWKRNGRELVELETESQAASESSP